MTSPDDESFVMSTVASNNKAPRDPAADLSPLIPRNTKPVPIAHRPPPSVGRRVAKKNTRKNT